MLLLELVSGQPLFKSDHDDNLVGDHAEQSLREWNGLDPGDVVDQAFAKVDNTAASPHRARVADLISWCLAPSCSDRPLTSDLKNHAYFALLGDSSEAEGGGVMRVVEREGIFLSHAQNSGGPTARSLKMEIIAAAPALKDRVWLDVDQRRPNELAMRTGVRQSSVFVLLLSKRSLCRYFCQLEIREAMRFHKRIVLVADEPSSSPDFGGYMSFDDYLKDAVEGDKLLIDGKTGNCASLFPSHVAVPFYRDRAFGAVGVSMLLEQAGLAHLVNAGSGTEAGGLGDSLLAAAEAAAAELATQAAKLPGRLAFVLDSTGHAPGTVSAFCARLARDWFPAAGLESRLHVLGVGEEPNVDDVLVLFLSHGMFSRPEVLAPLEAAERQSMRLVLMRETDTRHAAFPTPAEFKAELHRSSLGKAARQLVMRSAGADFDAGSSGVRFVGKKKDGGRWGTQIVPLISQQSAFTKVSAEKLLQRWVAL